jgi:deoxyribodipyrimidine photolyase-like uncharacterized protein
MKKTLAEDIGVAISCVQDYLETIDCVEEQEHYDTIRLRIERLMKFYYQLTGFDPNEGEDWKHAKYFDGTKWVDSWGEKK